MINKIFRTAGLAVVAIVASLAMFLVTVPPPAADAAVAWALTRNGSSVSIDSAGAIALSPKSGKVVTVSRGLTVATAGVATVADADALTVGGVIVPQKVVVTYRCLAAATCASTSFFIADAAYQVTAVSAVWGTAESTASNLRIQVEKLTGTTAVGSGTALLTNNSNAGISIKGTANTVTTGTLTATTASLQLAAGDRLGVKYETAPTEGAAVVVTVTLKRI